VKALVKRPGFQSTESRIAQIEITALLDDRWVERLNIEERIANVLNRGTVRKALAELFSQFVTIEEVHEVGR
jgi:hypothetical protein